MFLIRKANCLLKPVGREANYLMAFFIYPTPQQFFSARPQMLISEELSIAASAKEDLVAAFST